MRRANAFGKVDYHDRNDFQAQQQRMIEQWDRDVQAFLNSASMPLPVYQPLPAANPPAVNPAIREAEVKREAEKKEAKEGAERKPDGRIAYKGSRSSYIPQLGDWHTKPEVIDYLKNKREQALKDFRGSEKERDELLRSLARNEFGIMKQYNLSKHEPLSYNPVKFGGGAGRDDSASGFYNVPDYGERPDGRIDWNVIIREAWRDMSPEEQDAFIAKEEASKTAENIKKKEERQREAENREREKRVAERRAEWERLSPAERNLATYNRELAEYRDAMEENQYLNMLSRQQAPYPQMAEVSPVMLDEMSQNLQSQQARYVPVQPRRSVSDRVMSSFDPRLFSPEFIPEEDNGY